MVDEHNTSSHLLEYVTTLAEIKLINADIDKWVEDARRLAESLDGQRDDVSAQSNFFRLSGRQPSSTVPFDHLDIDKLAELLRKRQQLNSDKDNYFRALPPNFQEVFKD